MPARFCISALLGVNTLAGCPPAKTIMGLVSANIADAASLTDTDFIETPLWMRVYSR
jgi:hypothetical protein